MTTSADQPRPTETAASHDAAGDAVTHTIESWRSFVGWAAGVLGAEFVESADGFRVFQPTEEAANETADETIRWPLGVLTRRRREPITETATLDLTTESAEELIDQLLMLLGEQDEPPVLTPADQPAATHEITNRLFSAYQVDDGKIHLAGCRLEPTPFVRRSTRGVEAGEPVVRHTFVDESGELLTNERVKTLGLDGPLIKSVMRVKLRATASSDATGSNDPPIAATATLLATRAVGALQATIGGVDLSIPFNDWSRTLAAPPAICPETGRETFHLVAIDDNRIAAAEATGVCQQTGQRLLEDDLRTCRVTGRLLAAELCVTCPATGEPVAKEERACCPKCAQQVSRTAIDSAGCNGCRVTEAVPLGSPLHEELASTLPWLSRWRRWRTAEMHGVRIVEASTLWQRLLVVVELASGTPTYAATRSRFGGPWRAKSLDALMGPAE